MRIAWKVFIHDMMRSNTSVLLNTILIYTLQRTLPRSRAALILSTGQDKQYRLKHPHLHSICPRASWAFSQNEPEAQHYGVNSYNSSQRDSSCSSRYKDKARYSSWGHRHWLKASSDWELAQRWQVASAELGAWLILYVCEAKAKQSFG